jgi:hypothetical protein
MGEPLTWTTNRNVRIDDELWSAVLDKAAAEGTTASAVVRDLLADWVA